jgi:hypothetical protein
MSNKAAPPPVATSQGVVLNHDALAEAIQENGLSTIRQVAAHFGVSYSKAYKSLLVHKINLVSTTKEVDPTPEEIIERSAEIRKTWTLAERYRRMGNAGPKRVKYDDDRRTVAMGFYDTYGRGYALSSGY